MPAAAERGMFGLDDELADCRFGPGQLNRDESRHDDLYLKDFSAGYPGHAGVSFTESAADDGFHLPLPVGRLAVRQVCFAYERHDSGDVGRPARTRPGPRWPPRQETRASRR